MKTLLISLGIVAAIIIGAIIFIAYGTNTATDTIPAVISEETLTCADSTEITTQLFNDNSMVIEIDGVPYELTEVAAESGTRYANSDQSFIYWDLGNESRVLVEGEVLFEGCREDSLIEEENIEPDPAADQSDLIQLESPVPEAVIESPLVITGEARGTWFFEATFPIVLTNWDGLIIAEGFATADGEWMTEAFVPFTAELEFENPYTEGDPDFMKRGSLILQRANPSGLPENDGALEITVWFAE